MKTGRPRLLRVLAAAAVTLALAVAASSPAFAGVVGSLSPTQTSYDRPAIVARPSGNFDVFWAGTDAAGKVNYASVNTSGGVSSKFTYGSSTYPGTGVAANNAGSTSAATLNYTVVAWTDLNATVHVGLLNNGTIACDSTTFGSSIYTPGLTVARTSSQPFTAVDVYLVIADASAHVHVLDIVNNACLNGTGVVAGGTNSLGYDESTTISNQTSYVGPTLVDTTPGGPATLYLVWAGTNSAHNINIAPFTPGVGLTASPAVEATHATITDFGSSYGHGTSGTTAAMFTYCGTNNAVYGQYLYTGGVPQSELTLGGSCAIFTGAGGFVNGGVDVTANTAGTYYYLYPNQSNQALTVGQF